MSDQLRAELARIAGELGAGDVTFVVERPRDEGHGDWATNLALALAKPLRRKPREVAEAIVAQLALPAGFVARTEIAGPGFINFWLGEDALVAELRGILAAGAAYGRHDFGRGVRVNVEFVSANPTGPLHVGHGRGAALGDGIAALYEWTGHEVTREFYINDAGVQIDKLGVSLWARVQEVAGRPAEIPEGGYHGEYLKEAAAALLAGEGKGFADLPAAEGIAKCRAAALRLMRADQDGDLGTFGVRFDVMASEQGVRDAGKVEAALKLLAERGLTFEQDGALWFRTSAYGDDKDRVLRKSDGTLTYFVPDIAYHVDKHARGFHKAIDLWGADHHGYVPRMRAAMVALGYGADFFEAEIIQLVKVVRGGEEVRMSKRSGEFVTLRDLIEWVGVDAARYFFLMRRGDSPFTFDIDLARSQTDENPVFYVQMAHARMSGLFRVAGREVATVTAEGVTLAGLPAPQDQELLKKLAAFPEIVAGAARAHEPHRVTGYLEELARVAHGWYHHCRVLGEPAAVEQGRLALARAARQVLANGLALLGLSAPDRM
ncbi:MAG TPA: arginine--tRNA ligase [Gemmatimonadales bacterium]|nr:arginine--tRNA ligase [Gemmatimonadales bacterium]